MMPDELALALSGLDMPAFRSRQLFSWLQQKGAASFGEMTNLSKPDRARLAERFWIAPCEIERKLVSKIDGTVKYLFRLHDGETVEGVAMRYEYGVTLCISAQAGCRMACAFCASGLSGLARNLIPAEMLGQILAARRDLNVTISHIVLMGMGEPLDNYTNVLRFLRLASHPGGLNISQRKISLSTCGLVPKIDQLAGERLGLTLSVSLHAPNDEIRSALMPVNKRWPLKELMQACGRYARATGRRISFEYALFRGINDSPACAEELAALLKGMLCHVNLIPGSEVPELGAKGSGRVAVRGFVEILEAGGIPVTVRRGLGRDISAACGQLRRANQ